MDLLERYRRHWGSRVRIGEGLLRVSVPPSKAPPLTIAYADEQIEFAGGAELRNRAATRWLTLHQ
jgi:hypothetical protein